jgi:hypothetical protein
MSDLLITQQGISNFRPSTGKGGLVQPYLPGSGSRTHGKCFDSNGQILDSETLM